MTLEASSPAPLASSSRDARRPVRTSRRRRDPEARAARWFIAPALALTALFVYLPTGVAFVASFFSVPLNITKPAVFTGTDNFVTLISSPQVHNALWNTLLYCLMTIIPTILIGFLLALVVDALPGKQSLISTLLFLPLTANLVAMAVVFRWIYSPDGGFIASLLAVVGLGPIDFLGDPALALPAVAAVGVWRSAAFAMVLFMAGLTTIPQTVHEAAAMDGLRGLSKTTRIIVPMLGPVFILVTVISIIQSVQVFDTIQVMTQGGPQGSTETILPLIWRLGFSYFKLGEASALTLLLLVLLVALGIVQRVVTRKKA